MTINYLTTGDDRKKLVQAIAEILEAKPKYLGVPSCAYQVDSFTISKTGELTFDDRVDNNVIERLFEALCEKGFEAEIQEVIDGLSIELPLKDVTDTAIENLRKLVGSKAALIKKALGAYSLDIELTDDTLRFPWFDRIPESEVVNAAAHLIGKMLGAAKTQKHVTAKEKDTDNEKYTFRCFLLRLGFIGDDYKETRKVLLRNLTGSSAFKNGTPAKEAFPDEVSE